MSKRGSKSFVNCSSSRRSLDGSNARFRKQAEPKEVQRNKNLIINL